MKPRFRPGTHPSPLSLDLGSGEVLKSHARNFMEELTLDHLVLRYCRQIIMQAMDHVRSRMRDENLPALRRQVQNVHIEKSILNLTKAIDQEAEDLIHLSGNPITSKLALEEIFAAFRKDAKHPKRTSFVAAKNPALAEQVIRLLKKA